MKSSDAVQKTSISRRQWLQRALWGGSTLALQASVGGLLCSSGPARAADYKALVCLFLYGGNDGANTIVPTDTQRYSQYSSIRGALALPSTALVGLNGVAYGLHPALRSLEPLWRAGKLAPVFNLGPLYRPLSKSQYVAAKGAPDVPDNLFSHSDQQILWESASTSALTRTGWAGRAAQVLNLSYPVMSVGSAAGRFGLSATRSHLVLPRPGHLFGLQGLQPGDLTWASPKARQTALASLYEAQALAGLDSTLVDEFARMHREALVTSGQLGAVVQPQPGASGSVALVDSAFATLVSNGNFTSDLAAQLYQIARLIAANGTVGGQRQLYVAQLGGFDTHAQQITTGDATTGTHANLLSTLAAAMSAFQTAMDSLGLGAQVTTFTQSDFGRTLAPNTSLGTDHGWGNHQLVMGGAVRGGRTYGTYPELALGGMDDVGVQSWERHGRWLPTLSVSQYAATLLSWFGADSQQLGQILPGLDNFSSSNLGFV